MSELQLTARFTIHQGKLSEFKALAMQCMEVAREKDTGTLQYDWFLSADGTECVVRERYRDSEAVLQHAVNLGGLPDGLLRISDPDIEIYGSPSNALLEALQALRPRVYAAFQSI